MCGRYGLSKRKQIIEDISKPSIGKTTGVLATTLLPRKLFRWSPALKGTCPPTITNALGLDPFVGKKPFHRNEYHQCEIGDSRDEACVPSSHPD